MSQRRIGGNSSTQEWCNSREWQVLWNLENKVGVDDDVFGVSSIGHSSGDGISTIVGSYKTIVTILFQSVDTVFTMPTTSN